MSIFETHLSAHAPSVLQNEAEEVTTRLLHSLSADQHESLETGLNQSPELAAQLIKAIVGSEYLLESCCRDPSLLLHWLLTDAPFSVLSPIKIADAVETACSDELNQCKFDQTLRKLRRRFITALYWRDLNGLADFDEVALAMTAMAEVFIQQAVNFHYRLLCDKYGEPMGQESNTIQPLVVIGMGKLGGGELNVSSDIDLIFAYPEAGCTNYKKNVNNQQFFTLLGQKVIKSLNEVTVDGFVFRVDMRLRPYGQSGALASNFNALENYYQSQGRDWERYAMLKARVVACTPIEKLTLVQEALNCIIHPFSYRKYVDFSTIESLRQLKTLIVQEVRRKGLEDDVKLGSGGIREVEFIAQSFQLVRGGRDTRLQERKLLAVLDRLEELGHLSSNIVSGLKTAYVFLRKCEHCLQAYQDAQTQKLPKVHKDRERIAWMMGFENWEKFCQHLMQHRHFVSTNFQQVIELPQNKQSNTVAPEWQSVWKDSEYHTDFLEEQGFVDAEQVCKQLLIFQQSRHVKSLSTNARDKLDRLMPTMLSMVINEQAYLKTVGITPEKNLERLLQWLQSIVTRTSYVLLLVENPQVLKHLVRLFAASSWVAETLSKMPALLDELIDSDNLFSLPEKTSLRDELRQRLLRIDEEDLEAHLEVLRYFRLAHSLRVAACDITNSLPLMKISDYLTYIAEVVLEQVLRLALENLSHQCGYPEGATAEAPGFLIVAYGKLGGLEMSYSSDLDLVFIYDDQGNKQAMSQGPRPLDIQTYYTRLGQKIIHILNTRSLSGKLYEVDMRLRPSGNSGLLVSSLSAYSKYQQNDAWNWEHQALVRARAIAGDGALAQQFKQLRQQVLCKDREIDPLRQAVVEMRNKMREHLGSSKQESRFHLKHDEGGIVDIEFMVQYAVLAWAHQQPALAEWTDNIRILESLQEHGFIEPEQAEQLVETYKSYRSYRHRLALQQEESYWVNNGVNRSCFNDQRQLVLTMWNNLLGFDE